jgi:hypothetical protein
VPPPSPNRPTNAELRRLYEDERLTSRAIAQRCSVEKITVLRWMKAAGIPRRPALGLANRGIEGPTAEELHDMVHVQHLSYQQIAAKYGVDFTAVPHWLTRHGIPKPKVWDTRRRGIPIPLLTEHELRLRAAAGESITAIANTRGVSPQHVTKLFREYGIEVRRNGWRGGLRHICKDGHEARSIYERRVDDWLADHGLAHECEPRYPWDARCRADFLVGATWIEIWGVTQNATYTARRARKIKMCAETGLDLLGIDYWRFAKSRPHGKQWDQLLKRLLLAEQPSGDLFHC